MSPADMAQDDKEWDEAWSTPSDRCDQYGYCGPNSNCMLQSVKGPYCTCLPGFEPKSPPDYHFRARWDGCARKRNESTCRNGVGFLTVSGVKLPDTSMVRMNMSLSSTMCEQECLRDCSCTGYTCTNIVGNGNGCLTRFGDLWDTRQYSEDDGHDLHVRVDRIELVTLIPVSFHISLAHFAIQLLCQIYSYIVVICHRNMCYLGNFLPNRTSLVLVCYCLRCIHIGLLCVQECAVDRPTMLEVVLMLCSDAALPSPKPHDSFPGQLPRKRKFFP
ncbi:PAN/Apple domain [Dillenia turbinata]|uniref:non-specific serine/threonine protein kinase n=1 Tax=Dillenia turbinata TaxID=194707 RepID=A0AAN8UKX4_9MAGN